MQRATPGYCEMCGHLERHHRIGLGLVLMCSWCPEGRCRPEPEFIGTEWERIAVADRRSKIEVGSEIYLHWMISQILKEVRNDPDLFEQYMDATKKAWRILAKRGVVENRRKPLKSMIVEIGDNFISTLQIWATDHATVVDNLRRHISAGLSVFTIPFQEPEGDPDWLPEDD